MPVMTLKYRPIQYVEDPFKGECRNIGVIAYKDNSAYLKLIGLENGKLETNKFELLSTTSKDSSWVFAEWGEWFQSLVREYKEHPDSMIHTLEKLVDSDSGITVGKESEVEGDNSDPQIAMDWLYSRLVTEPAMPRNEILKMKIDTLLDMTGVKLRKGFEHDVEVEFAPQGKAPVRVQLPYAITETPRVVFKTVRFQTGGAALVRQINDAILTFTTIVEHGFADKDQCVVLTDKPLVGRESEAKRLAEYGTVIDVTGADAATRLNAVAGSSPKPLA